MMGWATAHTIYPDGKTVVYAYNDLNQVTSINDWDEGVTTYEYDENGRPITITLPNDTVSSLNYDAAGNVTSIVHTSDVGQVIGSYSYSYDATGRRLGAIENGTTISYTYDALYRLTDADHSNGNLYHYEYDAAGNRLLKQEPGETVVYTYDSANQLTHVGGAPTTLDANGNLLYDGSRSYAYDDLDRLIQVTQGISTTLYGYTGDGDRLWQQTDGVTTTFTLDLNGALAQVLAQSQGSALTTVNFLPGIGQQQSGGYWTYFHADALGSVRDLSGVTGNAIGHVDYSPFGEIVNSTGMASWFGFTGEQQDVSSGLTYLRARYYDPALGRFLTPDSLIPDITNGQALNAYAYVYNDPVNLVDPTGNIPTVGDAVVWDAQHAPSSWKSGIRDFASGGLGFIDKWYGQSASCQCSQTGFWNRNLTQVSVLGQEISVSPGFIGATVHQALAAKAGTPYEYVVTRTVEKYFFQPKLGWSWAKLRPTISFERGWNVVSSAEGSHYFKFGGSYRTGLNTRVTYSRAQVRPRYNVWNGLSGSVAIAGVIDGAWQFLSDSTNPCFSVHQRFMRAFIAGMFGLGAGVLGAIVFAALIPFSPLIAIPVAFALGLTLGHVTGRAKEQIFRSNPYHFGRSF